MSSSITIGNITAPDSEIARKAVALIEQAHTPAILNHVHRTWWFAQFLGRKRQMKYDRELLYLGSLLHDLGLSDAHAADKRFEVDGADASTRFLTGNAFPEAKTRLVWDAIALHSSADIAVRREPEVALVFLGAHVDVMGLCIDEISPELIDATLAEYPRVGFKKALRRLSPTSREGSHIPPSVRGSLISDVG